MKILITNVAAGFGRRWSLHSWAGSLGRGYRPQYVCWETTEGKLPLFMVENTVGKAVPHPAQPRGQGGTFSGPYCPSPMEPET
jgi:hypothetical protein